MTMPIDMLTAAQDALVALLRDQLPVDQRQMVRASLTEDARPPFHLIGDIDTENVGGKYEQAEKLTADVHTVCRGDDRRELLALMHPVRIATADAAIVVDGVRFRFEWLAAAASTAASDGTTYAGISTIEIFAEPA